MARHAAHNARRSTGLRVSGRLVVLVAVLVTAIGLGALFVPRQALAQLPFAEVTPCTPETVDVVVNPELQSLVSQILASLRDRQLGDNHCLEPKVRSQDPQDTVASSTVLPIDRAPQIWIPDTSVWGQKVPSWPLRSFGSLARTPVVLATSVEAAQDLGWARRSPTWFQALRGTRPVAVSDYQTQSESLDALIALWQSLGKGKQADQQVVATVLASDRGELPSPAAAIADARSGSSNAPLFPSTEQAVAYLNATSTSPHLTAVYPREGSPSLNYPIYQVATTTQTAAQIEAGQLVITRLTSDLARELARQAGFRTPGGADPVGTGISTQHVKVLDPPSRAEVDGMLGRIDALAKPSRILTVLDVSLSMQAKLDDGLTRIGLAGAAARLGVNVLPDSGSVGLWIFASTMDGSTDYRVVAPVRRLGSRLPSGETQRSLLMRLAAKSSTFLVGGGTSLYDVTIAAMKEMHAHYDPKASNAIIILTDGANEDSTGATLDDVLSEIRTLNKGKEKVAIYTGGLGPDADYTAMRKIALTSGGYAYRIDNALAGQQALLDGLRRSRKLS
jgi:Bacterial extracellular solute-binding protein/von Willebrand factor type A domain